MRDVIGQLLRLYRRFAQGNGPFDRMLKLADVAVPGVITQAVYGLSRERDIFTGLVTTSLRNDQSTQEYPLHDPEAAAERSE